MLIQIRNRTMMTIAICTTGFASWIANPAIAQKPSKYQLEIAQQCQSVCQPKEATWRTIDWKTDLLDAQNLAVELRQPLFIWAMDGHPLGCT